jgi:hypothetical protein
MGRRVWDDAESESQPVIGWIGVEPGSDTVRIAQRVHYPTRKRADFRLVARHEKADGDTETGVRRIGSRRRWEHLTDCWREPA